jgi:hypothetical protein
MNRTAPHIAPQVAATSSNPAAPMHTRSSFPSPATFRPTVLAALVAGACASLALPAAYAQALKTAPPASSVLAPAAPAARGEVAPQVLPAGAFAANKAVGGVSVEVERNGLPADGQTATAVLVRVFDRKGNPLATDAVLTVEVSGGRIQLPGARTDELGPGRQDSDRNTLGTQIAVKNGEARFNLLAPDTPQDVRLRVTAGTAQAEGLVSFVPELRDMVAVGLVEGVIRLSRKDPQLIQPVRLNDGFEAELRRFSKTFNDGKGEAAGRIAFFLKGKIKGDALLTAAFDSEKETRARLLRDIKPDEFYPVYGDSSAKSFDAKSASRLYVRIDKNKSYALYGDFSTADGFSTAHGGTGVAPSALRSLGAYSRTLTGFRGQWAAEGDSAAAKLGATLGAFAAYDSLKQVTEEFRALGTSGPYVLRNNSALENSEKVELLVRSKDNPGVIKSQRVLLRFDDYSFEPFSGRILMNRPVSSVDADGDPVSLRVTYEVDQGGDRFWVAGLEGGFTIGDRVRVGGAIVDDRNPTSPYRLGSVHLGARLLEKTWFTAEVARSDSTLFSSGTALFSNPTFQAGEQRLVRSGNAARIGLQHLGDSLTVDLNAVRTAAGFYNPSAPLQAGRSEVVGKAAWQLTDMFSVFGEGLRAEDRSTQGRRSGAALGVGVKLSDALKLQGGVRLARENGLWNGTSLGVAQNVTPGSSTSPTGGLAGGIDPVAINPSTGLASSSFSTVGSTSTAGQGISIDATTVFLGAQYQATERWWLEGLVEGSVDGDNKRRLVLGSAYRVGERSRVFGRYESQSGLTSAYGAAKANAFTAGAETDYMPGGQLFSEYRLRDATAREAQWANGVRNTWSLREGVTYTTAVEYLKVLNGLGGNAAAVALGYDNTEHALWKFGGKLEWRRVFDNRRTTANDKSDSVLSTAQVARKINRDWTLLVRNYLLANQYAQGVQVGAAGYKALQNRFQVGTAYRPVDNNRLDVLAKYENKYSRNADQQVGLTDQVHIGSVHAVWHPSRPWWVSGRLAAKSGTETGLSAYGKTQYEAVMVSGRLIYDVTENIDLGLMAAGLMGNPGKSRQSAFGVEAGYLVQQNLWLSAGYNWRGFSDRDLTASEYTNSGFYLRLRFKFDEDLFEGASRAVNRALDRLASDPKN